MPIDITPLLHAMLEHFSPLLLVVFFITGMGVYFRYSKGPLADAINKLRVEVAEHDRRQEEGNDLANAWRDKMDGKMDHLAKQVNDLAVKVGEHNGILSQLAKR